MAIVETVNLHNFKRAFYDAGRKDNFSNFGLEVLFDYLENFSDDIGENIELDVIALCCEYCEEDIDTIITSYDIEVNSEDENEKFHEVLDYLRDYTSVCGYDEDRGVIVYQVF